MKGKEKQLHLKIPSELHKKLKVKCAYEGETVKDYIIKIVSENLEEYSIIKSEKNNKDMENKEK